MIKKKIIFKYICLQVQIMYYSFNKTLKDKFRDLKQNFILAKSTNDKPL